MQQGRGELVEAPAEVVEMAVCDGQHVGHVDDVHVGAGNDDARAYRALTIMGFRETEAKRALAQVPGNFDENLEQLVRLALRELASPSTLPERLGRQGGRNQRVASTFASSAYTADRLRRS